MTFTEQANKIFIQVIQDYHLTSEFMSLFFNELKTFFNKFYLVTSTNKPKIGDRTIQYRDFYNKIVLYKNKMMRKIKKILLGN